MIGWVVVMLMHNNSTVHVCKSRTLSTRLPTQVFGLLSSGEHWLVYIYDNKDSTPVQFYSRMLVLDNNFEPEQVEKAVQPIMELLLYVYKKCLESSPLERPPVHLQKGHSPPGAASAWRHKHLCKVSLRHGHDSVLVLC